MADARRAIKKAARAAGNAWILTPDQIEDLMQDLWVEYLSRPSRRQVVDTRSDGEAFVFLRTHANQVLSDQVRDADLFSGDRSYSADAIKAVLKGSGEHPFLQSVVHLAVGRLAERHPPYAEALKLRYIDGQIPGPGAEQVRLSRAHAALAEEVHSVVIEYDGELDGPGSRSKVFPDSIRAKDGHSDPTGDMATLLGDRGDQVANEDGYTYRQMYDQLNESEPLVRPGSTGRQVNHTVNIFDGEFGGMAGAEMYRSWVTPELYPHQPQPLLDNWSQEDLEMYVGGEYAR